MDFRSAKRWSGIATLLLAMASPLRGGEINTARFGGSGSGIPTAMPSAGACEAQRNARTPTGMPTTSYSERPCFGTGGQLVEIVELSLADGTEEEFTETLGVNERPGHISKALAVSLSDLAAAPLYEKPAETKVPEPATLVLLGVGLIATSGLSRIKRQPKKVSRLAAHLGAALQH